MKRSRRSSKIERCDVAIIGSGFAGSLLARILEKLDYQVVLLERGTHPRFAIGESTTPLANLSLERLARRYGMQDCDDLAAYGRWLDTHSDIRRGLKRGFTFYRHHPGNGTTDLAAERLLVAASPDKTVSDTHWLRADVDHHFVKEAIAAGVDYRDNVELEQVRFAPDDAYLVARRDGQRFELHAGFIIDATGAGPDSPVAKARNVKPVLGKTQTRSAGLFSHFTDVRLVADVFHPLPKGPYPDDWAAVHHVIEEGWMYSLRFDHGVTSAGFLLRPETVAVLAGQTDEEAKARPNPDVLWARLLERYPTIAALFSGARALFPLEFKKRLQHRLARATGKAWAMVPHTYAFVDPLFSTGIAWSLRAVERLAMAFERARNGERKPSADELGEYEKKLAAEADQIDHMVAAAYEAMVHFDLFAAHAMIYFATVSFAEAWQRLWGDEAAASSGFLGVGDPVLEPLPRESLTKLRRLKNAEHPAGTREKRQRYVEWVQVAITPRNIAGLANPERGNLYPVDVEALIEHHDLLNMTREQVVAALPKLRGAAPRPNRVPG